MKNKSFFVILIVVIGLAALPRVLAQPGTPVMFLDEGPGGSSYLGVQTEDVTSDRVGQLHLKEERGVEVTMVDQDAPASKAGLKEHDVILSVNDQKVESVEQLKRVIREIPVGRTVAIGISRDGQPMTLKAQLAERSKISDMDHAFNFTMPPMPPINIPAIHIPPINMPEMDFGPIVVIHSFARSGLMVENLTPQLGDFFGVKDGSGVLVRSVEKGSRGEQAGFRAGDVITKINGSGVNDCSDFSRLLRKRSDNKASITVIRDRKEQNLTLALPETRHTGELNEKSTCASEDWEDCAADLKNEVAQLVPEMTTAELERTLPDMVELQKELRKEVVTHQKDWKRDMEKMRRELRQQQEELKKQLKEWVKDSEI
jgi:membrane-associated protease RseP (regulator of RpoE activity)